MFCYTISFALWVDPQFARICTQETDGTLGLLYFVSEPVQRSEAIVDRTYGEATTEQVSANLCKVSETDVRAETLESTAQLLVLRRDTLQIIDGAGPSVEVSRPDLTEPGGANGTEPQRETIQANRQQNTTKTVEEQVQTSKSPKCTFSGVVSIDLKRFADSGVALVECSDCSRTRTLSPRNGVLRFSSHDKRKTRTSTTSRRWARIDSTWKIVGS